VGFLSRLLSKLLRSPDASPLRSAATKRSQSSSKAPAKVQFDQKTLDLINEARRLKASLEKRRRLWHFLNRYLFWSNNTGSNRR
jgi:hypothetical protein